MTIINKLWSESWNECKGDIDLSTARVGGRSTKAFPNKEDVSFWNSYGPMWVEGYINWRKANPNWKIWETPQKVKAIELGLNPVVADVMVKMIIDRVFEVDGELVIVDLKTSQNTPASALQLGFYRMGMELTFGVAPKWGTYYMSRANNVSEFVDLESYTLDKMEYMIKQFDKARKDGIFLPNTNNCQYMCGLTQYCQFSSKKEK